MEQHELLHQIAAYQRPDGSYDVRRREKELGISFAASFWSDEPQSDDPLLLAMVEINGRQYDEQKAAERAATQEALTRALSDAGNEADWRLLEKRGLAVAEYRDPDSNAPSGYHLRGNRDIDGNVYSDQAGLEERPGRL
jgi:hypothetical protein